MPAMALILCEHTVHGCRRPVARGSDSVASDV